MVCGTQFVWLSVEKGRGIYRLANIRRAEYELRGSGLPNRVLSFRDANDVEWLRITPYAASISSQYLWNGNSPKRGIHLPLIGDLWFGTPDFDPGTIAASLIHDACFQFSGVPEFPWTLDEANDMYYQVAKQSKFVLEPIYRAALDNFSKSSWGSSPEGSHCVILPA